MRKWLAPIAIWIVCVAAAPTLPRSASLGVSASAKGPSNELVIEQVAVSSTASDLGLQPGDILRSINSRPIKSAEDLVSAARALRADGPIKVEISRGGRAKSLSGRARGRPLETYRDAVSLYGAVSHDGGLLRDILIRPRKPARGSPVVFLMQGFTCASVESGDPMHPYRQVVAGLAARGIAVYRIEKPGMGDSRGPHDCAEIDLQTELAAFEAGYRALQTSHGFSASQIFIFGHSLGGMEAPFIVARQAPPRGIAIYGISARNWYDYVLSVVRSQDVLSGTADPVEQSKLSEAAREPLRQLYLARRSPKDIATAFPGAGDMLRRTHEWDGGDRVFGRHYRFLQDLAGMATRQIEAWRDARTNVLALYGESDLIALDGEDARLVAATVNHYRPGSASFVIIPGLEHGMTMVGDRDHYRDLVKSGKFRPMTGTVGPALIDRLAGWIDSLTGQGTTSPKREQ